MCTEAAPPWDNAQVKDEPVSSSFFTCEVNISLCDTHPCTWWHPKYAVKQKADIHSQCMTNELKSVWFYKSLTWQPYDAMTTSLHWQHIWITEILLLILWQVSCSEEFGGLWMSFVLFTMSHLKNSYHSELNWCVAPPWRDPPGLN